MSPFKKKIINPIVPSEDAPLYIKEEKTAAKASFLLKEEVVTEMPVAIPISETKLSDTGRAMLHFGLNQADVFRLKDYSDKIVVVTVDGRKLTWPKS